MNKNELTLADHAEIWYSEKGENIPDRNSDEWTAMYERWHAFAFADFPEKI